MRIKPLGNRILAEPVHRANPTTGQSSLLVIPEANRPDDIEFRVVSVGPGRLKRDGTREPIPIEPGWRILTHAYQSRHVEHEGRKMRVIDVPDILMVLPP